MVTEGVSRTFETLRKTAPKRNSSKTVSIAESGVFAIGNERTKKKPTMIERYAKSVSLS